MGPSKKLFYSQGNSNLRPWCLTGLSILLSIGLLILLCTSNAPIAEASAVFKAAANCEDVGMTYIGRLCRCRRAKVQLDPFFQTGSKPKFYKFGIVEPINSIRVVNASDRPTGCHWDDRYPDIWFFNTNPSGEANSHTKSICTSDTQEGFLSHRAKTISTEECHPHVPVERRVGQFKYLIGIMSTEHFEEQEKEFTKWLPNLVKQGEPLKPGINFAFVVGKGAKQTPGRVVLNITENMNRGKTGMWIITAVEMFPDADFILKQDLDTAICPKGIRKILDQAARAGADYLGWSQCCMRGEWESMKCPRNGKQKTWTYMQGGFYGVSKKVAFKMKADPFVKKVLPLGSPPPHAGKRDKVPEDMATGAFVYREEPLARYFSFDHVEGCASMKFRRNTASRGQLDGTFTCPIQHLAEVTTKNIKRLACKKSICGLYDPTYFESRKRPKLIRPCWSKNVDECCAQPFDAWEPGWAPDVFPLCHGSGAQLDACLARGNAKMKAFVESHGIKYTHFAT